MLMLLVSCATYDIQRTGRHERLVRVYDITARRNYHNYALAKRKAWLMNCDKVEYLKVSNEEVIFNCIEKE